jgi:hypothetical protein
MKNKSSSTVSLTHLKSVISSKYTDAKNAWSKDPGRLGKDSIGIPPPEEVLPRQGKEQSSEDGRTDTLATSNVFERGRQTTVGSAIRRTVR